jgi:hypothetical protein
VIAGLFLALALGSGESSVAILYAQTDTGGMDMRCTATAFTENGKTAYLTAAHCVTAEDPENKGKLKVTEDPLFLSTDKLDTKDYVRAKVVRVGKQEKGYDFAILSSSLELPPLTLGDEREEADHVGFTNVAAPRGIGKATFYGRVALRFIDRPLIQDSINWAGATLVDVSIDGGSSGSALVSNDTGKIFAIVVGIYGNLKIAVPASRIAKTPPEMLLYPSTMTNLTAKGNASSSPVAR